MKRLIKYIFFTLIFLSALAVGAFLTTRLIIKSGPEVLVPDLTGQDTVTLVEGNSFCVCGRGGDMASGGSQGLYVADTRVVSRWELSVDGEPVEPVQALSAAPYHAMFLGRVPPAPGLADSTLLVRRERFLGAGMREDITVVNVAGQPAHCTVVIQIECDLADLFEVKAHRTRPVSDIRIQSDISSILE